MKDKTLTIDCRECESEYVVNYMDAMVSEELPKFCTFCGEEIESSMVDPYIDEDDDETENGEWD